MPATLTVELVRRAVVDWDEASIRLLVQTLTPIVHTRVGFVLLRRSESAHGRNQRQEVEDIGGGDRVMKEEEPLQKVAEAMGDTDFLDDPRWARLAAGELSDQEQKELREDMVDRPDASPEQLDAAFDTLKPLDSAFQGKIEAMFPKAAQIADPRPSWFQRIFGKPLFLAALAAATAAAILIAVLWPTPPAALPDYDLVFSGGDRVVCGGGPPSTEPAELGGGSLLYLRLCPATRATDIDSITLLAYLRGERIELPFRTADSGMLIVEGRVNRLLPVPAGTYRLVLVVVRKDLADDVPPETGAIMKSGADEPWQVFVLPLRIVDE